MPARVRYAVVGMGHIAQVAVLPAFAHARRNSQLVAIVSDDAAKRRDADAKENRQKRQNDDKRGDLPCKPQILLHKLLIPRNLIFIVLAER